MGQPEVQLFEALLENEGMPAETTSCGSQSITEMINSANDEAMCPCDALHDILMEAGMSPEDFLMAAERDPEGLQAWVEGQIGTIN